MKTITNTVKQLLFVQGFTTTQWKLILERVSLRKGRFLKGVLYGSCIGFVITVLAGLGHFKSYENPATDFLQSITTKKAKDVALVFITEHEYQHGFNTTSPLSRKRLATIVDLLVKLKARVIALDIDLSDSSPDEKKLLKAVDRASTAGIPVIVAGKLVSEHKELQDDTNLQPYQAENLRFTREGFFLFDRIGPGNQWVGKTISGGVFFRQDKDGVFRRVEALYMITHNASVHNVSFSPVPSFPLAVAAAYKGISLQALTEGLSVTRGHITIANNGNDEKNTLHIPIDKHGRMTPNFIGNYKYFDYESNLTRLLEAYQNETAKITTIFKDKAVIVGGVYDKNDFYMTPLGRMSGMEILANTTQSIISGNLVKHTGFWIVVIIEVLLGALASLLFVLTSRLWATVISIVFLAVPMTIVSIYLFFASYHWVDFIATIFGVMYHGWVSDWEKNLLNLIKWLKNTFKRFTMKTSMIVFLNVLGVAVFLSNHAVADEVNEKDAVYVLYVNGENAFRAPNQSSEKKEKIRIKECVYPGDVIEIGKDATITLACSNTGKVLVKSHKDNPYTVMMKEFESDRSVAKALIIFVKNAIREMLFPDEANMSGILMSRALGLSNHLLPPDGATILTTKEPITFKWTRSDSNLSLEIKDNEGHTIYSKETSANKMAVPIKAFKPGMAYIWSLKKGGKDIRNKQTFILLSEEESSAIMKTLDNISSLLPKEIDSETKCRLLAGYLCSENLAYEAYKLLEDSGL